MRHPAWILIGLLSTPSSLLAQQPEPSIAQLRAAAKTGDAGAQFSLGTELSLGDEGHRNPEEAIVWLRKAAEQGTSERRLISA